MLNLSRISVARGDFRLRYGTEPTRIVCSLANKRAFAISTARKKYPPRLDLAEALESGEIDVASYSLRLMGMRVDVSDGLGDDNFVLS